MTDMTASEPSPPVREDSSDWDSRSHVHALVMMAATVVGLYLCYRMAAPFVPALAWALALAILLAPLQRRLEPKLRSPGLAAGVLVLLVGVVLVLPAMLVADHLLDEAYRGADALTAMVETGQWRRSLEAHPLLAPVADWVERQQHGLDTMIGSGGTHLTPAQAQQIALARLVLADPHTLVLDEATSLIDPRTARHLEGSMHALLAGRTVVAIAHRLHTAHDADRIAVVIDGRIAATTRPTTPVVTNPDCQPRASMTAPTRGGPRLAPAVSADACHAMASPRNRSGTRVPSASTVEATSGAHDTPASSSSGIAVQGEVRNASGSAVTARTASSTGTGIRRWPAPYARPSTADPRLHTVMARPIASGVPMAR